MSTCSSSTIIIDLEHSSMLGHTPHSINTPYIEKI